MGDPPARRRLRRVAVRRLTALPAALAAAALALAGCGGPSATRAREEAAAICRVHAAAVPPAPLGNDARRAAADALTIAFRVNATDAALDALGAGGDTGARIRDLRRALLRMRDGLTGLRAGLLTDDLDAVPARAQDVREGLADADRAAVALGVPECRADALGAARVRAVVAVAEVRRDARIPSGDYALDLTRACRRRLPRAASVPRRPDDGPRAQGRAIALRQAVQALDAELVGLRPPRRLAALHRAIRADLAHAEEQLLEYADALGVSDAPGAADLSGDVTRTFARVRVLATRAGGRCP